MDDPKAAIAELNEELARLRNRNRELEALVEELHDSHASFVEHAPVGISIVCRMEIMYANNAWLKMFGFDHVEEVLGRNSLDFVAVDVRDEMIRKVQFLRKDMDSLVTIESVGVRKDNERFDLLLAITRFKSPDKPGYLSFVFDISEQKRARWELQRSMAFYKAVFSNASVGIAIINRFGAFLDANRRFCELYDYSREQLENITLNDLLHPESKRDTSGLTQQIFDGNLPYFISEKRYLQRNGAIFWGHMFLSAMDDHGDSVERATCIVFDITERKEAEAALNHMNKHLEGLVAQRTMDLEQKARDLEIANASLQELDANKTHFLSAVSHELRTPLTSIFGFVKLIRKDCSKLFERCDLGQTTCDKLMSRVHRNLDIIEQEGERLTRMVNDVLDLNKIEAGHQTLDYRTTSLNSCIYDAILAVSGLYSQKPSVKLHADIPDHLPNLIIDQDKFVQVLINLLHNAGKFTDEGHVSISARHDAEGLMVCIEDTGCGISEQDAEHIFDKFFQSRNDDVVKRGTRGTGLGLTICKQIIELFNGRIWADSSCDIGSRFTILLPNERIVSRET